MGAMSEGDTGQYLGNGPQTNTRNYTLEPTQPLNHQSPLTNGRSNPNTSNSNTSDPLYDSETRFSTESRSGRPRTKSGEKKPVDRSRSRTNGSTGQKSSTGQLRTCKKCGEGLAGQFVRALGGTFHLDCFKCQDCGQ